MPTLRHPLLNKTILSIYIRANYRDFSSQKVRFLFYDAIYTYNVGNSIEIYQNTYFFNQNPIFNTF